MDYASIVTTIRRLALEAGAAIMQVYDRDGLRGPRQVRRLAGHRGGRAGRRHHLPRPRGRLPRHPGRHRGAGGEPRRCRAGLLPRRPARRHQGVRAAPRRLHRQHRADRERRADPRRGLRACPGPAVLYRRRGPRRRRKPGRTAPAPGGAHARSPSRAPDPAALVVVASKSHRDQATDDYIARYSVADFRSAGSSLKFCLVAAGEADLYPRLGRTMEWDTAAGQAVLLGAGGRWSASTTTPRSLYGKHGFENPFFIAYAPGIELARRLSPTMPVLLVIPARYASTRYPGKPLAELRGATGERRSLIRRSWDAARRGPRRRPRRRRHRRRPHRRRRPRLRRRGGDDPGRAAATAPSAAPRWPRCFGGLRHRGEPAGRRAADPALVRLGADRGDAGRPRAQVATPVLRCDAAALAGFLDDRRHGRVGATTAVFDRAGRALYFSKEVIPYTGRPLGAGRGDPGLPPRRRLRLPPRGARRLSGLAGRAARDLGGARAAALHGERRRPVHCVEVEAAGRAFWELNNPSDVPRIEAILRELGLP